MNKPTTMTMVAMATILTGAVGGACVDDARDGTPPQGMLLERVTDGSRTLEVRALGPERAGELPAYELVYDDPAAAQTAPQTAVVTSPADSQANAPAVALLAQMPEAFRDQLLTATATSSVGDLLKKLAWLACTKWCVFIDGDPALPCATKCCADQNVADICI